MKCMLHLVENWTLFPTIAIRCLAAMKGRRNGRVVLGPSIHPWPWMQSSGGGEGCWLREWSQGDAGAGGTAGEQCDAGNGERGQWTGPIGLLRDDWSIRSLVSGARYVPKGPPGHSEAPAAFPPLSNYSVAACFGVGIGLECWSDLHEFVHSMSSRSCVWVGDELSLDSVHVGPPTVFGGLGLLRKPGLFAIHLIGEKNGISFPVTVGVCGEAAGNHLRKYVNVGCPQFEELQDCWIELVMSWYAARYSRFANFVGASVVWRQVGMPLGVSQSLTTTLASSRTIYMSNPGISENYVCGECAFLVMRDLLHLLKVDVLHELANSWTNCFWHDLIWWRSCLTWWFMNSRVRLSKLAYGVIDKW